MSAVPVIHVCAAVTGPDVGFVAEQLATDLSGLRVVSVSPLVGEWPHLGAEVGDIIRNRAAAIEAMAGQFPQVSAEADVVVSVGAWPAVLAPVSFELDCRLAAALGGGLLLVQDVSQPGDQRRQMLEVARQVADSHGVQILGVCLVRDGRIIADPDPALPVWTPANAGGRETCLRPGAGVPLTGATWVAGAWPQVWADATMSIPDLLARVTSDTCVVVPARRADLLLGLAIGAASGAMPTPVGVVAFGGNRPDPAIVALWQSLVPNVPLSHIESGGGCTVSGSDLVDAARRASDQVMNPLAFQAFLSRRARRLNRHIVLPEGTEPRILQAAAQILDLRVARLTLLGEPGAVRAAAEAAGVDVAGAEIVDPQTSPLAEEFAETYAELRKARGVTLDQARERMLEVSYFGTMMVHLGLADGMVSGAVHTTAATIRPAFEIIRTAPGVSIVSSVFLMALSDRVLVYGDCAVNPNPTPAQLAETAITSARTAAQFGVEPRVAMLSYSTGTSGAGPDVDRVVEATRIAHELAPEYAIDGPLQYDAAVDPKVAGSKAPGSPVAGRATVLIFPDLSSGNIAYKAVQQSAGAVAIGPVLQGLNKPVSDLSRGARVDDIVNTIAITAIQAGGDG